MPRQKRYNGGRFGVMRGNLQMSRSFSPDRWLVLAATLWAATVRFIHLHSLPPPASIEEAFFALVGRSLRTHWQWMPYYADAQNGVESGPSYLAALVQALGVDTITSLRVATAACGVLAVPLTYVCIRLLLRDEPPARRRWVAALAAVITAYLTAFVIASRVGNEPGLALPPLLFAVWQMLRGIHRRVRSGWVLAGLSAGLGLYFCLHARFVLVLLAFIALQALWMTPSVRRREVFGGMLLMAIAALAVALPLVIFFIRQPQWLTFRAAAITQGVNVMQNMGRVIGAFNLSGDLNPRHNVPGLPLLDPALSLGFLIGMVRTIWRSPHHAGARTLIAWLLVMASPAVITDVAPNVNRMIGVVSAAAALSAMGWMAVYERLAAGEGIRRRLGEMALPVLLAASLLWNTYAVFVLWPRTPTLKEAFANAPVEMAQDLVARAERGEWVFVQYSVETGALTAFDFILPSTPVIRTDLRTCLPLVDRPTSRLTYLVLSSVDRETGPRLKQYYPHVQTPLRDDELYYRMIVTLYEVPPNTPLRLPENRVRARFAPGIALIGVDWPSDEPIAPGQTVSGVLYWRVDTPIPQNLTAFVHIGTGLDEPLIAQHDAPPCGDVHPTSAWRPGEIIAASFSVTIAPDAPSGAYPVAVGWYAYPSLERTPLLEADNPLPDNRAVIATLHVSP